jgi:hypothetical protein
MCVALSRHTRYRHEQQIATNDQSSGCCIVIPVGCSIGIQALGAPICIPVLIKSRKQFERPIELNARNLVRIGLLTSVSH